VLFSQRANQPSAWSSDLLEKLTFPGLVEKFPAFYGAGFINLFTKARYFSVTWASSMQSTLPTDFSKAPSKNITILLVYTRPRHLNLSLARSIKQKSSHHNSLISFLILLSRQHLRLPNSFFYQCVRADILNALIVSFLLPGCLVPLVHFRLINLIV